MVKKRESIYEQFKRFDEGERIREMAHEALPLHTAAEKATAVSTTTPPLDGAILALVKAVATCSWGWGGDPRSGGFRGVHHYHGDTVEPCRDCPDVVAAIAEIKSLAESR